jgi:predicted nucleic acid-binding protein
VIGPVPPATVYLDTSTVVSAMFEGVAHSPASTAFCADLDRAGSRIIFFEVLWLELSQVLARMPHDPLLPDPLRQTHRLDQWNTSLDVRRDWLAFGVARFEALVGRFAGVTAVPFDRTIWQASLAVIAQHRLRSHDAIHVATARAAAVPDFATLDDDFRRVADLRVWLVRNAAP